MKKIILYNTLSRKKEEFKPLQAGHLSFYYCGPTVYWTQHIGNLRGSVCADLVHRTFKYLNYDVSMARNYTDVGHLSSDADSGEDKMEKASQRENLDPQKIAEKYINEYDQDTEKINILQPQYRPRATENIEQMIELIQILIAKSYAYATDLAIYFDVSKFPSYTELSRQKLDKNKSGAGSGDVYDPQKRDPADFSIWFFRAGGHKNALQYWPSPFFSPLVSDGHGFPGWHLECSAMIKRCLGETIDIHMGGIEHVSVHHSNEIAQSEAANGVKLANYWLHNEHLLVDDLKMSKSAGTSYSLADLEAKGFRPIVLRYFFLQAHYRSKQNFTFEALKAAQKGLTGIENKISKLGSGLGQVNKDFRESFLKSVLDDFNIPKSLSLISEILKSDLSDQDKLATILDFDQIWGLNLSLLLARGEKAIQNEEIEKLIIKRNEARNNKNFTESDQIRKKIESLGYRVEDSGGETKVIKI